MNYITHCMMKKLKEAGFSFPFYEQHMNVGMIYYYQNNEYFIGGFCCSEYSALDKLAANKGCWLPTEAELLEWLE